MNEQEMDASRVGMMIAVMCVIDKTVTINDRANKDEGGRRTTKIQNTDFIDQGFSMDFIYRW
jgi:hypothetical protein